MKILGKGKDFRWIHFFASLLLMVLGSIVALFVEAQWEEIKGFFASEPYVAVLISKKPIDFEIPIDFMDGFDHAKMMKQQDHFLSKNKEVKVRIRYEEDFLCEQKTTIIANKLSLDNNCILVIGNSNSSLTNINLDIFLNSTNKLPFIMPIATDSHLLKKAEAANYNAVLRMLPDNDRQAETIERLVSELASNRKVAIYGDEENQSYSINLSRNIADRIRRKGGTVVIEELIGPTGSFYNSSIKWTSENNKRPEVIVYAGVSHHGLLLIDQISEFDISIPIIFTDGCLVTSLLSNSSKISGRAFILSPAEFKNEDLFMPSYKPIGEDAYTLASRIISGSDGTREGVLNYIADHKKKLGFVGKAGRYGFNPDGGNEERDYIVYEMKGGKLERFTDF